MTPNLILSLFPGIDLLGMGFEAHDFTVVRGPDPLWGGDIRTFTPPRNTFEGIIGGPPCQDYSKARRGAPTGQGDELMGHMYRCITQAQPEWFLVENVPAAPWLLVDGYTVQRMHVRASEFGAAQHRLRVFQFGYRVGGPLSLSRPVTKPVATAKAAMASEGNKGTRRGWAEFCALQGLPKPLHLPSLTQAARYRAVGNGVDLRVATAIAEAIRMHGQWPWEITPCACECGRDAGTRQYATAACRKRAQRRRDASMAGSTRYVTGDVTGTTQLQSVTGDRAAVTGPDTVTPGPSHNCGIHNTWPHERPCHEPCGDC